MADFSRLPKVDLHVHLEGTISPVMVTKLAAKNGIEIPEGLIDESRQRFQWPDDGTAAGALLGFVHAYDKATSVMRGADDYIDLTYDYLVRSAKEGCIYAEIGISVDHGKMVGLEYPELLAALTEAYGKAKAETGIETRFISTCVRHYGPEAAIRVAEITRDNPHPLVTGFGMAGDENAYTVADFKPAYDIAGLPYRNAHAGEAAGPDSIRAARDLLAIRRFGHMVRAAEDETLIAEQRAINAVPEVCVSSNICLKVYPDYAHHPLRRFFDAGLKVTLGSDDPTFFDTSIGREYEIARDYFDFTTEELLQISRNAVEEAFLDNETRAQLLHKINDYAVAA